MSHGRKAVRLAFTTYIANANIPYLGTVYPARPTVISEQDYTETMFGQAVTESTSGSACVLAIHIPTDNRNRQANVGSGAFADLEKHLMFLELFFASTGGDSVAAQLDYDEVVDALILAIRKDPTPGPEGTVWSAGEFKYGVKHAQGLPETSDTGQTILIAGSVSFEAYEWLQGTTVVT